MGKMRFSRLFTVGSAFAVAIGGVAALSPSLYDSLDQASDPVSATGQTPTVPDGAAYRPEFLDENYWHPKNSNYEIIDWERWFACNPVVPFQHDPPQRGRQELGEIFTSAQPVQWGRQGQLPAEVIATGERPMVGTSTDPEMGLFKGLLGPRPESSLVPEVFRNKLLWLQDNWVNEYIVSLNRGAWRTNTEEGRAIGLVPISQDWALSTTELPFGLAMFVKNFFLNFQMSPDGKWIKFFFISTNDPSDPEAKGKWFDFYVVQEGDVFTDKDGNVMDWVKPGDTYRIEYGDLLDPYECKDVTYLYWPRVVATLDEITGEIPTVPRNYDDLVTAVTADPPAEVEALTQGFTTSANLTSVEKYDFISDYEPDRLMYLSAPEPPFGDIIENIGVVTVAPTTSPEASPTTGTPTASPVTAPFSKGGKSKAKSGKGKKGKAGKRNTGS